MNDGEQDLKHGSFEINKIGLAYKADSALEDIIKNEIERMKISLDM